MFTYSIRHSFGIFHTFSRRTFSDQIRSFAASLPQSGSKQGIARQEYQKWTPEEMVLLLKLREDRLSWAAIIAQFPNRTLGAIKLKYSKIAPRGDRGRYLHTPSFTDAERALLSSLRAEGITWAEIQRRHFPNRCTHNLIASYTQTRIVGEDDVPRRSLWDEKESEELLMLREERKLPFPDIAKAMNRTHASVKRKYVSLIEHRSKRGVGDDTGYVRVEFGSHWSADEQAKLVGMIKGGATRGEITATWPQITPAVLSWKTHRVKKGLGLSRPRRESPVDDKSIAKVMRLLARGSKLKELVDLMPGFTLGQVRYAYRQGLKRQKEEEAKVEKKAFHEKE